MFYKPYLCFVKLYLCFTKLYLCFIKLYLCFVSVGQRARARASLLRHGFDYKTRCRLHEFVSHGLVEIPQLPKTPFAGLCQYERMHTFYINYCSYLMDLLCKCVKSDMKAVVHRQVKSCHHFRDPITGRIHPRLQSLLNMTHLTAERRVRAIFYWAHVLGTKAEVIHESMRTHCIAAVSTLQLLLIATRGHRAYSQRELEIIFVDVGHHFFQCLETISEYVEHGRMERGTIAHQRNPNNTRPPVPFKRMKR